MRSSDRRLSEVSAALSVLTFSAVTAILLLLTYYFLSSDMSFYYVWHYSSTDLSQLYRLSGVWAGAAGSFLLWIWFMTLVLATEVVLEPRRKHLSKAFHGVFQIVVALIIFLFVALLAYMNLFERTGSFLLGQYPNGYGMSLVLQTPEMVVHPPVVFAGYAFCVVAFAAGASYFVTKDANWFHMSLPWARLGWIFLTLGIGIGAIWAYYVLGWGGYWAWDPVDVLPSSMDPDDGIPSYSSEACEERRVQGLIPDAGDAFVRLSHFRNVCDTSW